VKRGEKNNLQPKMDPKVKDILILLGAGVFLAASIIMPGLPMAVKPFLNAKRSTKRRKKQKEWEKFNQWRLRQVLKRMYAQKLVEISEEKETPVVKISENGKKKLLKYNLEEMVLAGKDWDDKWRIIIYDITSRKRWQRELFRKTLKRMNFFQLQKSVYLTPFKCHDEIEYLRQVCEVGNEVVILTVSGIENEQAYRSYFGLR
jgi:CRISPR-associated endonuclease Cas2